LRRSKDRLGVRKIFRTSLQLTVPTGWKGQAWLVNLWKHSSSAFIPARLSWDSNHLLRRKAPRLQQVCFGHRYPELKEWIYEAAAANQNSG